MPKIVGVKKSLVVIMEMATISTNIEVVVNGVVTTVQIMGTTMEGTTTRTEDQMVGIVMV